MLFSSMIFLWVFLPFLIVGNFILSMAPFRYVENRMRAKNAFLLICSLFFYAWGGVNYLLIMLASIVINYCGGLAIHEKNKRPGAKKGTLILVIVLNLGMLFFFKYFNMLVVILESLLRTDVSLGEKIVAMVSMEGTGALGIPYIVLPVGISFFTFQAMSYVVDVYTGKTQIQKSIVDFALYVSLFPQLIAGPIVKYSDVASQINEREESLQLFAEGIKRFCYGLGKKVLIANTFAQVADDIWALETSELGAAVAWFGAISYTLQIYYDFSGYSDMAIGLGKMFGFSFRENFHYPYMSASVQEFWRRWHISLSSWFKEYVYIPLGGNRKGAWRTYRNIFIVFLLTGVWHGANFTFIVWGLYYAFWLIMERLFLGKVLEKKPMKLLGHVYTLLVVTVGWVYFRSDNIYQANEFLVQMFTFGSSDYSVLSYLSMKVLVMLAAALLCGGFLQKLLGNVYKKASKYVPVRIMDILLQMVILIYSAMLIVSGTYNPFIYFQF